MNLRPYQQTSHDKIIESVKKTTAPVLLEAATGAGKSHIIAAVAATIHDISKGKKVLCLAPSAELVVQNSLKYKEAGYRCSIFSAGAGEKSLRHPVVFGTPGTVKNKISQFGKDFAAIILDEADGLTPTVLTIIEAILAVNPNCRIIGMTATPFRLDSGYIYAIDENDRPVPDGTAKDPFFYKMVHRVTPYELIEEGYLSRPIVGSTGSLKYDTLSMKLNKKHQFDADDIDKAFHGHGRKTSQIVAEVVDKAKDRKGVMFFAATVQHAEEIMASLPKELSAIVTSKTHKSDRQTIISKFKRKMIKYIVNVSVLTVGFDAPHVDVIVLMRATESRRLLQQIIGRGLRPIYAAGHPLDTVEQRLAAIAAGAKRDCLLLDYAQNIERHCPDGDVFDPKVRAPATGEEAVFMTCTCPLCLTEQEFSQRPNDAGYSIDDYGYFTDLDGNRIPTEWGDIPAHYGRRCHGIEIIKGEAVQCEYRWTFKPCPNCEEPNDIAARYCTSCKGEIIDPNKKLHVDFKAMKRDPTNKQTDEVLEWVASENVSRSGRATIRIDVVTPYRSFSFWIMKNPTNNISQKDKDRYDTLNGEIPTTITYQKEADTGFYRIHGYNRPYDEAPPEPARIR